MNKQNKPIIIMKFGGASLANAQRMQGAARIIQKHNATKHVVVVVSALQGVTDLLVEAWNLHKKHHNAETFDVISALYIKHIDVLKQLQLSEGLHEHTENQLKSIFGQLTMYLSFRKEHTMSDYDYVVSFGEKCSTSLLTAALNDLDMQAKFVNSSECIITSKNFGNAHVYLDHTEIQTQKTILPLLKNSYIPIVTGFFGATKQKEIAILGRGGSDYSATILGYVLNAKEVILWKEVDGVFCSDPKKNPHAQFFSELSYEKALSLAENGAKILHREAMKPVREKSIPVLVKNVFRPEFSGTKIWKGAHENA